MMSTTIFTCFSATHLYRFYTHRKGSKPDTCESDDDEPPGDPEDMEWDDRPNDYFEISGFYFELEAFPERAGRLYTNSDVSLWKTLQELFLVNNSFLLFKVLYE